MRNLEVRLPAVIFICDNLTCCYWSRTIKKGRIYKNVIKMLLSYVQELYKMYEMYEMYKEYKVKDIWDSIVFAKESEASHLLIKDMPPWYNSRSTWEPTLAVFWKLNNAFIPTSQLQLFL